MKSLIEIDGEVSKDLMIIAQNVALDVIKFMNQPDELEIAISFVSEEEIKRINSEFRNIDKVTDVLSFPSALEEGKSDMQVLDWDKAKQVSYDPETESVFLGDIVVCLAKAKKQAREFGHGIKREVCYLSVHGLLHLLGYDHMKENDKK